MSSIVVGTEFKTWTMAAAPPGSQENEGSAGGTMSAPAWGSDTVIGCGAKTIAALLMTGGVAWQIFRSGEHTICVSC
jgi:hypothetical protein